MLFRPRPTTSKARPAAGGTTNGIRTTAHRSAARSRCDQLIFMLAIESFPNPHFLAEWFAVTGLIYWVYENDPICHSHPYIGYMARTTRNLSALGKHFSNEDAA